MKSKVAGVLMGLTVFYLFFGMYYWVEGGPMPWNMDAEELFLFSIFFPAMGIGCPIFWGRLVYLDQVRKEGAK